MKIVNETRLCDFVFTGEAAKNAFWFSNLELDEIDDRLLSVSYPAGISGDKLNALFADRDTLEAFARLLGFLDFQNLLETRGGAHVLFSEDFYREIIDQIRMRCDSEPASLLCEAETREGSGITVIVSVCAWMDGDTMRIEPIDAYCDPSGYDVPGLTTDEIFKNLTDYCHD